jgi:hypothetical protein
MKSINIKGKEYVMVNERILEFKKLHPEGSIITELLSNIDGVAIFKATIIIGDCVMSVGHAYEKDGATFINKTSHIENCETSAVGRALGIFGIGIGESIASAEEVGNAVAQQSDNNSQEL